MFTDFTYANLGLPRFADNNFYLLRPSSIRGQGPHRSWLMDTVKDARYDGAFRVPTLRNIARTPPYGHNGYFFRLREMVDFHASRDVGSPNSVAPCDRAARTASCPWPAPEVPATVDRRVGNLGLSSRISTTSWRSSGR